MDHADHVALIRTGVVPLDGSATPAEPAAVWADIGSGSGAFTLALADLLGPGATIVAIDRDAGALRTATDAARDRFPTVVVTPVIGDFTARLSLPPLDGLVAANSLHFIERDRQVGAIRDLARHLRPDGRFVVVEYDTDHGNRWVPFPFSSGSWVRLAHEAGLVGPVEIGRVPSRFLGAIYASCSRRPSAPASRSMSDAST